MSVIIITKYFERLKIVVLKYCFVGKFLDHKNLLYSLLFLNLSRLNMKSKSLIVDEILFVKRLL